MSIPFEPDGLSHPLAERSLGHPRKDLPWEGTLVRGVKRPGLGLAHRLTNRALRNRKQGRFTVASALRRSGRSESRTVMMNFEEEGIGRHGFIDVEHLADPERHGTLYWPHPRGVTVSE